MGAHRMDLGTADVATPGGAVAKRKAARAAKAGPAKPKSKRKVHVRADIAEGGSLHVRHMSDDSVERFAFQAFDVVAMADTDPKPVWVQIAKAGAFKGHGSGPFEMSGKTFADIVRNFAAVDGGRVHFDFEHASEADATDGSVPQHGAPAQGWITQLDNRGTELWGLVDWLEPARTYIREGKYKAVSPAIRFNAKHPVTGAAIGARLTSVALTNSPFLRGMADLAASDKLKSRAYSSNDVFPTLRSAMRMADVSTPAEMSAQCARLRELCEMADSPTGTVHGVNLAEHLPAMRDAMRMPMSSTWGDVFDAVEDMIDAAIDQHVIEDHGGVSDAAELDDEEEDDSAMRASATETQTMNEDQIKLRDAESKLTDVATKLTASEALIALKDSEIAVLKAWRAEREEKDIAAEVDAAFETYKDAKKLTDADRANMLVLCKAAPEAFAGMYPKVKPSERHLQRNIAGGGDPPPAADAVTDAPVGVLATAKKLMKDENLSYDAAMTKASRLVHGKRSKLPNHRALPAPRPLTDERRCAEVRPLETQPTWQRISCTHPRRSPRTGRAVSKTTASPRLRRASSSSSTPPTPPRAPARSSAASSPLRRAPTTRSESRSSRFPRAARAVSAWSRLPRTRAPPRARSPTVTS